MQASAADARPDPSRIAFTMTRAAPLSARPHPAATCADHAAPEVRRRSDQRLARDLTDQVLARHRGLEVLVHLRDLERRRHGALGEHHQRLGRAREHARLALDAVVKPQHAALVLHEVEHVGRAHRDARIATRAAVVVDVVNQDPRAHHGRRSLRGAVAPAGGHHREHRHQQDGEAPERQRDDPGHAKNT
jgi:hypothetical protein